MFVSKVCDEQGDVLLELRQVLYNVVLVELGVLVVLGVLSHREEEVGLLEVLNHLENGVLDGDHLLLDVFDLVIFFFHLGVHLFHLDLQLLSDDLLLFFGHVTELLMSLDLSLDALVLLFNHIDFRVEHVDVVVKRVVLLLSFDESGHDFFSG